MDQPQKIRTIDILPEAFYGRSVNTVARELIGCRLMHGNTGGIIVETEAYGPNDPACHASRGRTNRNSVMFGMPGRAYIYFTYGMHHLVNIVCEVEGIPAAVLIRALEPTHGIETMKGRRAAAKGLIELTNGPAKIAEALAIDTSHYGQPVFRGGKLKVFERPADWQKPKIVTTSRIGITMGTRRKWRYCADGSRFLSRKLTGKGA